MLGFIKNNWGTVAAGIVVLAVVAAIVIKLIRDKKRGKCLSCDGCSECDACRNRR